MPTITQSVADIAGVPDNSPWVFFSEQVRESADGTKIITTDRVRVPPVNGVLSVDLDPGPAVVVVGSTKYPFTVPNTDSDLWSLIEESVLPPDTTPLSLAEAVAAYFDAHPGLGGSGGGLSLVDDGTGLFDIVADDTGTLGANVKDYGAVGDGTTNDTSAIQAAINAGTGAVFLPQGNYRVTALTIPNESILIVGSGTGVSELSFATPNSALITLTNPQKGLQLQNLHLTLTSAATGSTLVDLSNTFKHSFHNVIFQGQHQLSSVSTFKTQTGVKLRDNAGDNRFSSCEFNNLGNAVRTDAIQNHFVNCLFSVCWKGVIGGDPTGAVYAAGISMTNCNMVGGTPAAPTTSAWIEVTGSANVWWLENIWIEGCDKGIIVGNGTVGPSALSATNVIIAAATKCIDVVAGRQTYLANIRFDSDPGATATDLTINATNALDGFAVNLVTDISHSGVFDVPAATFPGNWVYISRSGSIRMPGGGAATLQGFDTLENKYLIVPKINEIHDPSGNSRIGMGATGIAVYGDEYIANSSAPATPSGGGVLYVESGALKYKGSSGTVTTLGPA